MATIYNGFDYLSYPGDNVMQAWWNSSPFYFTGFYLGPAPNHSDKTWMDKRKTLKDMGWGFFVLYVGRQQSSSSLSEAQGRTDAQDAASLAKKAGFPYVTRIFFDIEAGGPFSAKYNEYIGAWADEIWKNTDYVPGFYCSYKDPDRIKLINDVCKNNTYYWPFNVNCPDPSPGCDVSAKPDPANSGVSYALGWQYAQSPQPGGVTCGNYSGGQCPKTYGGYTLNIDLDTSTSTNPSNG